MSSEIEGVRNESPVDYVEPNPSVEEFVEWAAGKKPDSPRLRSVVGPPGSGKSTFLHQCYERLRQDGLPVLWFDLTRLEPRSAQSDSWYALLDEQARELSVPYISDRSVMFGSAFHALLETVAQRLANSHLILFVDAYDGTTHDARLELESQVLIPFLFPPGERQSQRYVVVARRDLVELEEAILRWEEEVHELEVLDAVGASKAAE